MNLQDILDAEAITVDLRATNRKGVLQDLSQIMTDKTTLTEREIFDTLLQREKLGSTGIGHGVAIPHGKFAELEHIVCWFARLSNPIDFEAPDNQPVDLVFVLLAPETAGADHLKALASVARTFRQAATISALHNAGNANEIYSILTAPASSNAA